MESALRNAYANAQKWGQVFGVKLPDFPQPQKIISPLPAKQQVRGIKAPTPTPTPSIPAVNAIKANLDRGFAKYGSPPIATKSAQLAQLGHEVAQRGGNPYLPAVLTIKETGGLKYPPAQAKNNPAGIGPGISYPNLDIAILGGGTGGVDGAPQKGMRGVLLSPTYDDYYKSGNLEDFYKRYTPASDPRNPSYQEQIELTNELLKLFEGM